MEDIRHNPVIRERTTSQTPPAFMQELEDLIPALPRPDNLESEPPGSLKKTIWELHVQRDVDAKQAIQTLVESYAELTDEEKATYVREMVGIADTLTSADEPRRAAAVLEFVQVTPSLSLAQSYRRLAERWHALVR